MSDEKDEVEKTRALFEEAVFRKYFISQVKSNLTLKPKVVDGATLLARKKNGSYKRTEIAAMWFGWKLRVEGELARKAA